MNPLFYPAPSLVERIVAALERLASRHRVHYASNRDAHRERIRAEARAFMEKTKDGGRRAA